MELAGRSVLIATDRQLAAAAALMELDGIVRRLILCPPDVAPEYLPEIVARAEVDAIVSDRAMGEHESLGVELRLICSPKIWPTKSAPSRPYQTEWILLTSGTTGRPKMIVHTLASLSAAIKPDNNTQRPPVWATFYDIRRYGGLQILLRSLLGGASFVISDNRESVGQFLARICVRRVTHVTGTPSHWRRVLWSGAAGSIAPRYVRMSGEIADQAILDSLRAAYPRAKIVHAYASTEAGVGFEVDDECEGFPTALLCKNHNGVELKIEDGTLRVRSAGAAVRHLGERHAPIASENGFVDTGDVIKVDGKRCYFAGRTGGVINVGGLKVHPEEIEAVINRHPKVSMALVRPKKNAITGWVVVADVVLARSLDHEDDEILEAEVKTQIFDFCRERLAPYKIPAIISFVPSLAVTRAGKLERHNA